MPDAVVIIAETIQTHQIASKRIKHPRMPGALRNLTGCSGCDWVSEALNEAGLDAHRQHVAAAVNVALGYLEPETQFKYTHLGTGKWTILEAFDVPVARKIAGTTHELSVVSRWVSGWADAEGSADA
ncbi:hypothetical protein [Mycolicibacterium bacteremicum]|uniref:Uncharacterized protein n=1 Tax=Mycolicibacterium bacteremicum TaxID=564198 RepID=A0A1W9YQ21_MYCBA|nr:hypothetical protein [Mycolicibacterium bacteremicum]MCV7434837.1 hypothetical protein [Mycolicibacterium bacteremicum]ORA02133.1 hypothetical protein BST17_24805 [Mycolicibacterium bacteremicum]